MSRRIRIDLKPDEDRIRAATLYLMSLADNLSQYDIVKSLFLADRAHLNKYGRPITFDNYVAMEHGPVPTLSYDSLKPGFNYKAKFKKARPWIATPEPGSKSTLRYVSTRPPNLSNLSETDIEELRRALGTVRSLSFGQLRKLTHEDAAYTEAWARRGFGKSYPMLLQLLIESNGEELAADLAYMSQS